MPVNPAADGELPDEGFAQLVPGGIVGGFLAGVGNLELRLLHGAGKALALPRASFRLHEEPKRSSKASAITSGCSR